MNNKQAIRDFVISQTPLTTLADDENIFETGLVSSMFVMQLVVFIENSFGILISGNDLNFDHFKNVDAIANLIALKGADTSAGES